MRVTRPRAWWQRRRVLAQIGLDRDELATGRRVSTRISHRDAMHGGAGERYFAIGLSGLRCVERAVAAAGRRDAPRAILDLPCGHGRVLRWLAARYPAAELTACDLDRHGVDYCAQTFGAHRVYSHPDLGALELDRRFDLIWCGSLVTHLDVDRIAELLRFFAAVLQPRGVAVVTTHGEHVAEQLRSGRADYLLEPPQIELLLAGHEVDGVGYVDYPGQSGYGISLTSPDWVRAAASEAGLHPLSCAARGWDDHQDVFSLARA